MSSSRPTKEQAAKDRKWVVVDAANVPVGRVATKIAALLRGKNKRTFTPHADTGDFVVVVNSAQVALTGNKFEKKSYYDYSGYVGGLKEHSAADLHKKHPDELIRRAVQGMIPHGPLGYAMLKKLKIYPGTEHPHKAQQPEAIKV